MTSVVLGLWLVQSAAGAVLLVKRLRRHRSRLPSTLVHTGLSVAGLAGWLAFAASGAVAWGWGALLLVTVGNAVGDSLLVGRSRAHLGASASTLRDYRTALASVFAGRFPALVTFHAVFAGVAYFGALAACLAAS